MAFGSCSGFAIGALAPFIVRDLGLSRSGLGLLTTVVFVVSAAASPVAGRAVDVLGGRRLLMGVFGIAGAALLAMAATPSYAWLLAAAALSGVATAIMNPATNQLISTHIPRGSQGTILGVKQSGVQFALFAVGLFLPSVALHIGWRGALAVAALPAAAGLAAVAFVVPRAGVAPRPAPGARASVSEPVGGDRGARASVARDRMVVRLTAYAFLMGFGSAAVTTYLVLFGVESVGLTEAAAGLATASLGLAGIVSRVAWARRVERMSSAAAPLALMALAGLVCVGLILLAQTAGAWLLWVGAVGFGATASAWNAVGNLVLVRELPLAVAGRASGVMQVGFYGGFIACPVVFGFLADTTRSYGPSWTSAMLTLAIAGLIAWRGQEGARHP
jgi:predicted MFS family arabinose efflux permease